MKNQKGTWVLSLIMAFGIMAGAATSAAARPNADSLPQTKEPSSSKFTITGAISISNIPGASGPETDSKITGSGATSGNDFEFDLTLAGGSLSGATDVTVSEKLIAGKLYVRIPISGVDNPWFVSDAPAGTIGGISGVIGTNPSLESAYTVTNLGKDNIDGVATTKYQIDTDLAKLGSVTGTDVSALGNSTVKIVEWVGDADMYVHYATYSLHSSSTSGGTTITTSEDLSIAVSDFDVPVTITAPADAQPISSVGNSSPIGGGSSTGGMPTSAGMPGMPVEMPIGMPVGMPTTGSGSGNSTLLLALLAISFGLVLSGVAVKHRAYAGQRV